METPSQPRVVIVNHGLPGEALALKQACAPHAHTLAIDSGSALTVGQQAGFDLVLANVYFSGLVNAAVASCADMDADAVLFFVCSDVAFEDAGATLQTALGAFADDTLGVWAPASTGNLFPSLSNARSGGMREVAFVEGFCMAARLSLWRRLAPVDLAINRLGWGLDIHLAWQARRAGLRVCVDDRVQAHHVPGTRYNRDQARAQLDAWVAGMGRSARFGHGLLFATWMQDWRGRLLLRWLPPRLWRRLFAWLETGR